MYSSIYEAVSGDSNTVYLSVPEDDYFISYDNLSRENVQDLVENYFKFTGRDGLPVIADIDVDANTHKINITVDVDYDRDTKIEPASAPHYLAQWRER